MTYVHPVWRRGRIPPPALRVVGGDEKEPSAWGYSWTTLFLGDIDTRGGPDPPGWGSLESETVKCGHESRGTRT
jgi:hypothetical protein